MRDFLIKCGYPAKRAEMVLGSMKPYHRPEWWVMRRPAMISPHWQPAFELKSENVIGGIDEVYLVDRHCFVDRIDWGGIGMYQYLDMSLILVPFGYYVIPGGNDEWEAWRENPDTDDILTEMEQHQGSGTVETITLKKFASLDSNHRKRLFRWQDHEHCLNDTVAKVFDGVYDHESGNPTYC